MKIDRELYWNKVAADLEAAAFKHEYSTLYSTLRKLSGKSKVTNDTIKKADGTFIKSSTERLQRWKEFFNNLYNHDAPQGVLAEPPPIDQPATPMSDAEPTIAEVNAAIGSLKIGKAAGLDPITTEEIKASGDILHHRLYLLVKTIWHIEQIPAI
ncbi:uncharacterized protein LOC111614980 [Centruroides sculpturatus]|uniref:uncharacterized protein LOC111614980 n=1 Tax=Centruroides sculpturatus TaxID=218467 RepID=UPI000C6DFBC4|nr:uncharacterized protein LOC111614980 [Centruroides sculpturatus]